MFSLLRLLAVVIASTRPAAAELGGNIDSVYHDSAHMAANVQVRNAEHYRIYEITTSVGTTIREFVSSDGMVFGIAWEGPFAPEMKQLLGKNYEEYEKAIRAATTKYGRRPLSIHLQGLEFETGGHMAWYVGRAYIPLMMPSGAKPQEIR
jgi:hypothetical protein